MISANATRARAEDSMKNVNEEAEIHELIERWAEAVRAADVNGVVANHTDDMVMFVVPPPSPLLGIGAYRDSWLPFFKWQREHDGVFEIISMDVTAGTDVAFVRALLRCGSRQASASDFDSCLRLTVGLRKQDGRWRIAHEHHSYPLQSTG
jgi:uncharacterized protein (TIGR02246 family)